MCFISQVYKIIKWIPLIEGHVYLAVLISMVLYLVLVVFTDLLYTIPGTVQYSTDTPHTLTRHKKCIYDSRPLSLPHFSLHHYGFHAEMGSVRFHERAVSTLRPS